MSTPTPASSRALSKTGYKSINLPRYTPEFQDLFSSLTQSLGPGLSGGIGSLAGIASGDPGAFEGLEAPALRQFQELSGGLGARFSQLGAQRSSGFKHALGGAAGDLAQSLQSQRMGLQQQAIQQLMGMYGQLAGTDLYDTFLTPQRKKRSIWESLIAGGLPVAGAIGGGYFGGPQGAAMGAQLGSSIGSSLLGD